MESDKVTTGQIKRIRWTRVIVVEGDESWVNLNKAMAYVPDTESGKHCGLAHNKDIERKIYCTESKTEQLSTE